MYARIRVFDRENFDALNFYYYEILAIRTFVGLKFLRDRLDYHFGIYQNTEMNANNDVYTALSSPVRRQVIEICSKADLVGPFEYIEGGKPR